MTTLMGQEKQRAGRRPIRPLMFIDNQARHAEKAELIIVLGMCLPSHRHGRFGSRCAARNTASLPCRSDSDSSANPSLRSSVLIRGNS